MRLIKASGIPHLAGVPFKLLGDLDFVQYEEDTPTENARKLHERELDMALIPAVEFAQHGGYESVEFGMGTRQKTDSMVLYANDPVESLERIHIYQSSSSSMMLLKVLLREKWGVDPQLVRREKCELFDCVGPKEGALALHELPGMIRYDFDVVTDLGTAWYELTGKPFVFLLWAMRPGSLSRDELLSVHAVLHRAAKASGAIARSYAAFFGTTPELSEGFIAGNRRFYLDGFMVEGLCEFFNRAHSVELLPKVEYRAACSRVMDASESKVADSGAQSDKGVSDLVQDVVDGYRLTMKDALWLAESGTIADLSSAIELLRAGQEDQAKERRTYFVHREALADETQLDRQISHALRQGVERIRVESSVRDELGFGEWCELLNRIRQKCDLEIQAFEVGDILQFRESVGISAERICSELGEAGLSVVSALSGEMLLDKYMKRRGKHPQSVDQWATVVRWLHRYGVQCICGMRISPFENWEERLIHLNKLRTIQDENPGFVYFVPVPIDGWEEVDCLQLYLRCSLIAGLFLDRVPQIEISNYQQDQLCSVFGRELVGQSLRVEIA